ncbi:MAG: glutamate--tRNA ligase family protein [Verrucomicrobiota bacterium]
MSKVRTRFAPSPTGLLHVGGARTALFNWLFARHHKGSFVLRIEDTDASRNTPEAIQVIFQSLEWLGLDWDEGPTQDGAPRGSLGPYRQSQRNEIYQKYIQQLLQSGHAYEEEKAVRFKLPKGKITVEDLICGPRTFDLHEQPDITIRRPDGSPIFHLVNVVDDLEMQITHVLRGEDHLQNTPKHLALFKALGASPPAYAHIPLILNPNGSKMSKRDLGSSIGEYLRNEFIPDAIVNYLCLLGWSPKDNSEMLTSDEIISRFDLHQINRSNARFDMKKLHWLNGEYWKKMDRKIYLERANLLIKEAKLEVTDPGYLQQILLLIQERIKTGFDLVEQVRTLVDEQFSYDEKAEKKVLKKEGATSRLETLLEAFSVLKNFSAEALEEALLQLTEKHQESPGAYMPLCRFSVSGQSGGPSLYHMLEIMGQERTISRMQRTLKRVSQTNREQ